MIPIRTERLILRNWRESDRHLFHRINSEDAVMEFFPFRRSRTASDSMLYRLQAEIEDDGYGFAAVEIATTGECIGFTGILEDTAMRGQSDFEIGWRLAPEFWGKGYVTEAANAWLAFALGKLNLPEIVSFAVQDNHRSTAVMQRIGMVRDPAADFDHPKVPDTHPHLKRHVVYRLSRQQWLERQGKTGC